MAMFGRKDAVDAKAKSGAAASGSCGSGSGSEANVGAGGAGGRGKKVPALTVIDMSRSTNIAIGLASFRSRYSLNVAEEKFHINP